MPTPVTNEKISQLANGNPAQSGDLLLIARGGNNYTITPASIVALALTSPTFSGTATFTGTVIGITASMVGADAAGSASTAQSNAETFATSAVATETTRAETAEALLVPKTTTVNGTALSGNIVISASQITTGTLPHAQLPTLLSGDIPNNAANTSGTAANLSGTPALPNGTTATTQSGTDSSSKIATTAFVSSAVTSGVASISTSQLAATEGNGTKVQLTNTSSNTAGDVVTYDGSGNVQDSGTALSSLAPIANATFTGTTTTAVHVHTPVTVTYSSSPTFNASAGNAFKITLGGNVTSSTLSGATAGQLLIFEIIQDSTGGRSFTWPTNVIGGMDIVGADQNPGDVNMQLFYYDGSHCFALTPGVSS